MLTSQEVTSAKRGFGRWTVVCRQHPEMQDPEATEVLDMLWFTVHEENYFFLLPIVCAAEL